MVRPVLLEPRLPCLPRVSPASADAVREMFVDPIGHQELRVLGASPESLCRLYALGAQRRSMGFGSVLDRRAVADMAVDDDQGRPLALGLEVMKRLLDLLEVIGVGDGR